MRQNRSKVLISARTSVKKQQAVREAVLYTPSPAHIEAQLQPIHALRLRRPAHLASSSRGRIVLHSNQPTKMTDVGKYFARICKISNIKCEKAKFALRTYFTEVLRSNGDPLQ